MVLRRLSFFAFACVFVLLGSRSALANPQDDEFDDDDAFEDDESFEEEEGEDSLESEPVDDPSVDAAPVAVAPDISGESDGLLLTEGTMQAGGMIGLQINVQRYEICNPENPAECKKTSDAGGTLTFAPQVGYFLMDNLELLAEFGFVIPFGDTEPTLSTNISAGVYPAEWKNVFFNVGGRYVMDLGLFFYLYGGLQFGMNFVIYETEEMNLDTGEMNSSSDTLTSILITVPAGLLIPFNRHVALDVGTRFIFDIGVGDNEDFWLRIPIAYFGVEGFFNFFD
ncbi:MAG: hypothetical protein GY854_05425 [Deltaproteobacteria bacterium]|nr:hypothetical protein [Deltaproteobacteria bacterium]